MPYAWMALLLLAQVVNHVDEVPNPRRYGEWVTDQAKVIESTARGRVNARIERLNQETGLEIAVVTVTEVPGAPRDFALNLFNHWGIGSSATNNGLLIFLVIQRRRLEVVTGTGLETLLTDAWLKKMQEAEIVPLFRSGLFGSGIEAGLRAVEERLLSGPLEASSEIAGTNAPPTAESVPPSALSDVAAPAPPRSPFRADWMVWALGGAVLIGGTWLGTRKLQALRYRCRSCGVWMLLLDEIADNQHLDRGQQMEEKLGSLDYDVYICSLCQESRIVPRKRWFSSYILCPSCGYRTNKRTSRTRVRATTHHGGEVEIRESCSHCKHRSSGIRYTSRRSTQKWFSNDTRPSSFRSSLSRSSGRPGGFFGGGRSRGGGSGSSW